MTTERITRLQSLLDRIKKNAALPKQPLGRNFVLGGTLGSRSDVATGPSVPVAQHAPPPAAHSDVAAQRPALAPAAAPPPAAHSDVAAQRPALAPAAARPQPQIAAAPPRVQPAMPAAPVASKRVEELDLGRVGAFETHSSHPPHVPVASQPSDLELDDIPIASAHVSSDSDIDNLSWSEPPADEPTPPPDSSRRERVASSLDEALVAVTTDSESEIHIKTPPPESGRQPTDGIYAAAMSSEAASMPTVEQLGDTLELEPPTVAALELDSMHLKASPPKEELEVEFPPQKHALELPGSDAPPDSPAQDSPHRAPERSQILATPDATDRVARESSPDDTMLSSNAELLLQPQVTQRSSAAQQATIEVLQAARAFAPRCFLELLDASLNLGRG